jgi:hypothetical protein
MWESYLLKQKNYSLFEQAQMPGEERKWIMEKIEEEAERAKQGEGGHRQL